MSPILQHTLPNNMPTSSAADLPLHQLFKNTLAGWSMGIWVGSGGEQQKATVGTVAFLTNELRLIGGVTAVYSLKSVSGARAKARGIAYRSR